MSKQLFVVLLLLQCLCVINGFDYSSLYNETVGKNRDGKFLFDTLFGLDFPEELLSSDTTNTLKNCDCGEFNLWCFILYSKTNFK